MSADRQTFEVDSEVAKMSVTISNMIDGRFLLGSDIYGLNGFRKNRTIQLKKFYRP